VADIVKVVTETIGINESLSGTLTPVHCRNCKRRLAPSADFEYCCAVYYVDKWRIQQ